MDWSIHITVHGEGNISVVTSVPGSVTSVERPPRKVYRRRYRFDYRRVDGSWRAYILRQPDYNGQSELLCHTHRFLDENGYYVCWSEPIRSRRACRAIAQEWARRTDDYISTGKSF